ncbi:MAG: L-rhamnose mutarotase [Vallitaleaceae bacterium]|nr:L-rhamnose mutarotase [Vallitaleaceae bacterium]
MKQGCVEGYIQAHHNIRSEMIEEYKKAGIEKISCFKRGLDLYIYSECNMDVWESFDKTTMEYDKKFQEHMRKIAETVCEADELLEVFHLD